MALTLKAWRRAREISLNDMAKMMKKDISTIRNWENKPEKITMENAYKLAEILDVPLDQIIFLSENPTKL